MKPELPSRKYFLSAVALSVLLLGAAGRAKAVLIFDNSGRENSRTIRDAGSAPGTFIFSVAQNTLITNISVLNHLNAAGSLRFVIFSHPAETLLFVSTPEAFGADPVGVDTWRRSADFIFTLQTGQQYDIGAIARRLLHLAVFRASGWWAGRFHPKRDHFAIAERKLR